MSEKSENPAQTISETEFARIAEQIRVDREQIYKFNPNVSRQEVLLWMLLSCLISFLNLTDDETPCFPGAPDAEVYRTAILHVLRRRAAPAFDADSHLARMLKDLDYSSFQLDETACQ